MKSWQSEPESSVDWLALVLKVKSDDPEGRDELHRLFSRGIRFYLNRRLGLQQLDARVQETFTFLVNAIKREELNEHKPFISLVRAIVLQQVAAYCDEDLQNLGQQVAESPGRKTTDLQNIDRMVTVLKSMAPRDREALTRFYFHEQTQARICEEMQFDVTQFLLRRHAPRRVFWRLLWPWFRHRQIESDSKETAIITHN